MFFNTLNYLKYLSKFVIVSIFILLITNLSFANNVIIGMPIITDGDTIKINNIKIRLYGIDTPEKKQTCLNENHKKYFCGKEATNYLKKLIKNKTIYCLKKDLDQYGRIIGVCFDNNININAKMVESGWALAYRKFSIDYIKLEEKAQNNKLGLWSGDFIEPWKWRRGNR